MRVSTETMRSVRITALATVMCGMVAAASSANAADLTLVASTAMREVLEAAVPAFERETGHVVHLVFLSGTVLPARIGAGMPADLVIASPETLDDLVKAGKLVAGTRVDFVRSSVGVAVRAGAPKPDISTVDHFKRALLGARSVGISQGPSGVHMMGLLEQLGIAGAVRPKAVITEPGQREGLLVADGRAELGVQQISETAGDAGHRLRGTSSRATAADDRLRLGALRQREAAGGRRRAGGLPHVESRRADREKDGIGPGLGRGRGPPVRADVSAPPA